MRVRGIATPAARISRLLILSAPLLILAAPQHAFAIPAFARKYQASCQTCHVAYPKLNSFGNAFRLRGYRMPGETEAMVKQPDVELGAEGYKRVWPKAVWPGAIPGHIPVSFAAQFLVRNSSAIEEEDGEIEREIVHNDLLFPAELELILAGSAGNHVAFFGEIEYEQEVEHGEIEQEVSIGHVDVRFIGPIGDSLAFNLKVGSWQPELVTTFDHARRLTIANYDSMFGVNTIHPEGAVSVGGGGHHGGGQGLALPSVARGIDLYGIVDHRLLWTAGIANGLEPGEETFDANSSKDYWARIAYKWGGMSLDGHNAADYAGTPKNWREKSFQLGVFGYWGDGSDALVEVMDEDELLFIEDEDYTRIGVDFNWFYKDLNVFGAYVEGDDDLVVFEESLLDPGEPGLFLPDESGEFSYEAFFVEVDWVLGYPWLHGVVRYEQVDLPGEEDGEAVGDWERATVHLTGLVRANVKAIAEYTWDLDETENYQIWFGAGIAF